jgi:hypothetical protein
MALVVNSAELLRYRFALVSAPKVIPPLAAVVFVPIVSTLFAATAAGPIATLDAEVSAISKLWAPVL